MNYFTSFMGVSLGGIFSQYMNVYVVLLCNAGTFIVSSIAVSFICLKEDLLKEPSCNEKRSGFFYGLKSSITYIKSKKFILKFMIVTFISNISYNIIYGLIPAIAKDVFNSPVIYSALQIGVTLGSSIGLFIIGNLHLKKVGKTYILSSFLSGGVILLFSFVKYNILAIILIFLFGFVDTAIIPIFSYNQKQIDDKFRGRVISITNTVILSGSALMNYIIAIFSSKINLYAMYLLATMLLILSGMLGFLFTEIRTAEFKSADLIQS